MFRQVANRKYILEILRQIIFSTTPSWTVLLNSSLLLVKSTFHNPPPWLSTWFVHAP